MEDHSHHHIGLGWMEYMSERNTGRGNGRALLKPVVTAMVLLAFLACGGATQGPEPTSEPPPGMFSVLPTTENPSLGDQPPTIELNTPEPTLTPQPTPTPILPIRLSQRLRHCLRAPLRPTRQAPQCRRRRPTRQAHSCRRRCPTRQELRCQQPRPTLRQRRGRPQLILPSRHTRLTRLLRRTPRPHQDPQVRL